MDSCVVRRTLFPQRLTVAYPVRFVFHQHRTESGILKDSSGKTATSGTMLSCRQQLLDCVLTASTDSKRLMVCVSDKKMNDPGRSRYFGRRQAAAKEQLSDKGRCQGAGTLKLSQHWEVAASNMSSYVCRFRPRTLISQTRGTTLCSSSPPAISFKVDSS